jgi:hypothetical protein
MHFPCETHPNQCHAILYHAMPFRPIIPQSQQIHTLALCDGACAVVVVVAVPVAVAFIDVVVVIAIAIITVVSMYLSCRSPARPNSTSVQAVKGIIMSTIAQRLK